MRSVYIFGLWLINLLIFLFLGSGPIPDGADAVVPVEDTEQVNTASDEPKRVRILAKTTKGTDIRPVVCYQSSRVILVILLSITHTLFGELVHHYVKVRPLGTMVCMRGLV